MLWGAGSNGKDLAKLLKEKQDSFHWVCDNQKKIGKHIYDVALEDYKVIPKITRPQIIIAVTSPKEKSKIKKQLTLWEKEAMLDYWFFI